NYQKLFALRIGENVKEMFECDMLIEVEAVERLRAGIEYMRSIGDVTSARIFEAILEDEEHHLDYLETQLALLERLGEPPYPPNGPPPPPPDHPPGGAPPRPPP